MKQWHHWHHRLNGHGFGWTLGVGDGQGGLACCGSWSRKELDTTERLNWTKQNWHFSSDVCMPSHFSCVWLFATHQSPRSMGFSRQEHWSELPFYPPRDLPDAGIEPTSPTSQADSLSLAPPGRPSLWIHDPYSLWVDSPQKPCKRLLRGIHLVAMS